MSESNRDLYQRVQREIQGGKCADFTRQDFSTRILALTRAGSSGWRAILAFPFSLLVAFALAWVAPRLDPDLAQRTIQLAPIVVVAAFWLLNVRLDLYRDLHRMLSGVEDAIVAARAQKKTEKASRSARPADSTMPAFATLSGTMGGTMRDLQTGASVGQGAPVPIDQIPMEPAFRAIVEQQLADAAAKKDKP